MKFDCIQYFFFLFLRLSSCIFHTECQSSVQNLQHRQLLWSLHSPIWFDLYENASVFKSASIFYDSQANKTSFAVFKACGRLAYLSCSPNFRKKNWNILLASTVLFLCDNLKTHQLIWHLLNIIYYMLVKVICE